MDISTLDEKPAEKKCSCGCFWTTLFEIPVWSILNLVGGTIALIIFVSSFAETFTFWTTLLGVETAYANFVNSGLIVLAAVMFIPVVFYSCGVAEYCLRAKCCNCLTLDRDSDGCCGSFFDMFGFVCCCLMMWLVWLQQWVFVVVSQILAVFTGVYFVFNMIGAFACVLKQTAEEAAIVLFEMIDQTTQYSSAMMGSHEEKTNWDQQADDSDSPMNKACNLDVMKGDNAFATPMVANSAVAIVAVVFLNIFISHFFAIQRANIVAVQSWQKTLNKQHKDEEAEQTNMGL